MERMANYGNYPKCVIPANFVGNSKIKQLIILKSTGNNESYSHSFKGWCQF